MENYIFTYCAILLYFACSALFIFHLKLPHKRTVCLSKKHISFLCFGCLFLHCLAFFSHFTSCSSNTTKILLLTDSVSNLLVNFFCLFKIHHFVFIVLVPSACISKTSIRICQAKFIMQSIEHSVCYFVIFFRIPELACNSGAST